MRLSYTEDISDSIVQDVARIVHNYRFKFEDGEIFIDAPIETLQSYISNISMVISQVLGLAAISRKRSQSNFMSLFDEFISTELNKFNPEKDYMVDPSDGQNVKIDYSLSRPDWGTKKIFLYAVSSTNNSKASEIWGSLLYCQNKSIDFRSLVIFENIDKITKNNRTRLMNISDATMEGLENFKQLAPQKIERLRA